MNVAQISTYTLSEPNTSDFLIWNKYTYCEVKSAQSNKTIHSSEVPKLGVSCQLVTTPSMVSRVVYGPRYGQFGGLAARWDNYLGRGHFGQSINPATSAATACQRQSWQGVAVQRWQPRWCKWGAERSRGCWRGYLGLGSLLTLKPKQSLLTFISLEESTLNRRDRVM